MRMSQDKRLLPCASGPPPHVSITLEPESWWMSLDVVHFLLYTINLSAPGRSAARAQGVHLEGHLASWLCCPAPISLCLMSQDPVPVEWCWAVSCSTCMQRCGSAPPWGPSVLPGGGWGMDAQGAVLLCHQLRVTQLKRRVPNPHSSPSGCIRPAPQALSWTGLPWASQGAEACLLHTALGAVS